LKRREKRKNSFKRKLMNKGVLTFRRRNSSKNSKKLIPLHLLNFGMGEIKNWRS